MPSISNEQPSWDHKGNFFPTIRDMCAFWNIKYETFSRRIKVYNMSLEDALTKPVKYNGGIVCYDHLGEKYYSVTSMCEHWGIARKLYEYRISHGWSQEKALTTPPRCQIKGLSQNAMCRLRQPLSHKSWKKR